MPTIKPIKPNATVTIEPVGPRTMVPRDHAIKVVIRLSSVDPQHAEHADPAHAMRVARKSLAGFPPAEGQPDRREFLALSSSSRLARTRTVDSVVVAVEGSVVWPGVPGDDAVERCRAALLVDGYRVELHMKRECADPACEMAVLIDWDHRADLPAGWSSNLICGRHNFRTCPACKSTYMLTSTSYAGGAPSLECQVCGLLLVGWGSSKLWTAALLTKGRRPAEARRARR
jgi:hypothetical protein